MAFFEGLHACCLDSELVARPLLRTPANHEMKEFKRHADNDTYRNAAKRFVFAVNEPHKSIKGSKHNRGCHEDFVPKDVLNVSKAVITTSAVNNRTYTCTCHENNIKRMEN